MQRWRFAANFNEQTTLNRFENFLFFFNDRHHSNETNFLFSTSSKSEKHFFLFFDFRSGEKRLDDFAFFCSVLSMKKDQNRRSVSFFRFDQIICSTNKSNVFFSRTDLVWIIKFSFLTSLNRIFTDETFGAEIECFSMALSAQSTQFLDEPVNLFYMQSWLQERTAIFLDETFWAELECLSTASLRARSFR